VDHLEIHPAAVLMPAVDLASAATPVCCNPKSLLEGSNRLAFVARQAFSGRGVTPHRR
jgi:hypothetical protein